MSLDNLEFGLDILLETVEYDCEHKNTYKQQNLTVCRDCGKETCEHKETEEIDGLNICIVCGDQIKEINYTRDWRYYTNKNDPSRCHKRNTNVKNLYSYVSDKNFVQSIIENANEKYKKISDESETSRGKNKKATVAACIYAAHIDEREPKTAAEIGKVLGLTKKNISKGFEVFYKSFPEYKTMYIEAVDLIRRILIKTGIDVSHYVKIKKLCEYLQAKSNIINRSTPQSVACSIVYLYICLIPKLKEELGMTKSKFTQMVDMSDITISKICKHSLEILGRKDIKI